MQIKHEILSFNPILGAVEVRYYTDEYPVGFTFNLDLPIVNGALPSEAEITETINFYAPRSQLERAGALSNAPIPEYLSALIPPPPSFEPEEQSTP